MGSSLSAVPAAGQLRRPGAPSRHRHWHRFNRCRAQLHARFPAIFPTEGQPRPALAIGISTAVREAMGWGPGRTHGFLGIWTDRTRYLQTLAAGGVRLDLDGRVAGPISEEHQARAIVELERRACRSRAPEARADG